MKKSQSTYVVLAQEKWFFSCIFAQFAQADKNSSKAVHLLEENVIKYCLIALPCF
jgi:hypothetical protein